MGESFTDDPVIIVRSRTIGRLQYSKNETKFGKSEIVAVFRRWKKLRKWSGSPENWFKKQ